MRRLLRWTATAVLALLLLATGAFVVWANDAHEARPGSVERAAESVDVTVDDDGVVLEPADGPVDTAVVFYPGARVEPEAYAASWAPVVDETGVGVVVPRMPLNLAVLAPNRARTAMERLDADTWYVGGHSMGGAMAAYAAGDERTPAEGLVLWGAYATESAELAGRTDLRVLSVSASEDGLSDPATTGRNRPHLPQDAVTVEVEGMNHAQFGDYGPQKGDGTAQLDDDAARAELARVTSAFLSDR